jgi:hypothetical protein
MYKALILAVGWTTTVQFPAASGIIILVGPDRFWEYSAEIKGP